MGSDAWAFQILGTGGAQGDLWASRVAGLPRESQDIHFAPDYARIYELTYNTPAFLATYGDEENCVIYPFLRADAATLPFVREHDSLLPAYDISNPYGYGGPLARTRSERELEPLLEGFFAAFHQYCLQTGIVAEYARLHPLLGNYQRLLSGRWVRLIELKQVIYMDLTADSSKLWAGMGRGHRSSVNKARRLGVVVKRHPVRDGPLADFRRLYAETMDRLEAAEEWQFPESYFSNCATCLGDDRISIFTAYTADAPIASCLVMHAYGTAYYHFGGSSEAHFDLRANNLLLYEVALWAKGEGLRSFHLGGGQGPNDSLYQFKSGFSKKSAPLFSYSRVHDAEKYQRLLDLRAEYNHDHGIQSDSGGFFPAYRMRTEHGRRTG